MKPTMITLVFFVLSIPVLSATDLLSDEYVVVETFYDDIESPWTSYDVTILKDGTYTISLSAVLKQILNLPILMIVYSGSTSKDIGRVVKIRTNDEVFTLISEWRESSTYSSGNYIKVQTLFLENEHIQKIAEADLMRIQFGSTLLDFTDKGVTYANRAAREYLEYRDLP